MKCNCAKSTKLIDVLVRIFSNTYFHHLKQVQWIQKSERIKEQYGFLLSEKTGLIKI